MSTPFSSAAPVLVTGGAGFIGSHLVERLIEVGVPVRCLVRRTTSLKNLPHSGRFELVYGDLAGGAGLGEALADVDTVFHLAGVTKANSTAEFYRGNVEATGNLLRACEKRPPLPSRFIHISSLAAIGPSPDGSALSEDAEPRPLTHYGKSKLAAERLVAKSRLAGRAVIVRPAVVFGPRDTDVYQVFRAISRGLLLTIGREPGLVSIIYVKDLVQALLAAAASGVAPGRAYFVANPRPVSWTEFGATAAAIMGRHLRSIALPPLAARTAGLLAEICARVRGKPSILSRQKVEEACCRFWLCSPERAERELGFSPRWNLHDAMAETLSWYKAAAWLKY